jgi:hypothetical protein
MTLSEAKDPTTFAVDYYVKTPRGSMSRFKRTSGLNVMRGSPMSETAVLSYLRTKHPGTEIQINRLSFS